MGRYKRTSWHSYLCGEYENDPLGLFAAQIVIHAVEDWRELIRARAFENGNEQADCNLGELRMFFKSDWCELLLQRTCIEAAAILETLEAELVAAMQQPPPKKKKRKGARK